eukprot:CAMPEP_0171461892 /NCGR_PEP_ID=MMETSP0945-20130129/6149_1 /TAXON_ID=109269 /ORGANISM="Vaucheria litorea, Strain CCMP2940" /LENGTH=174 /DNA_ID=CAMNT_0011988311 /DNA_START=119 /DNA_END=640 /DNA_ORIENTATION=+
MAVEMPKETITAKSVVYFQIYCEGFDSNVTLTPAFDIETVKTVKISDGTFTIYDSSDEECARGKVSDNKCTPLKLLQKNKTIKVNLKPQMEHLEEEMGRMKSELDKIKSCVTNERKSQTYILFNVLKNVCEHRVPGAVGLLKDQFAEAWFGFESWLNKVGWKLNKVAALNGTSN